MTESEHNKKTASSEITVDLEREIGKVSRFMFGQNLEPATCGKLVWPGSKLSNKEGIREDVLEITKRINVPIARWPGGNFASAYHWFDGVGDRSERRLNYDLAWRTKESNFFGTDEFLKYCDSQNAVPFITLNAGSGTVDEAASWVEYCNLRDNTIVDDERDALVPWRERAQKALSKSIYAQLRCDNGHPAPYDVKYWSIGNETWGDFQIGNLTGRENAIKAAEYAKVIRRVDPRVNITGVGMNLSNVWRHFRSQNHTLALDWNLELLRTAGEIIDNISVHRYFFREVGTRKVPFCSENYLSLLACPVYSERKLKALNGIIDAVMDYLEKEERITISFDEWLFGVQTPSHGLATARFFNVLLRMSETVPIACGEQWIASVSEEGIVVHAGHLAFELYQKHLGEVVLHTDVTGETYDADIEEYRTATYGCPPERVRNIPYLDSVATVSGDRKKLYLATVNIYKENPEPCRIRIRNASVGSEMKVYELNGADIEAGVDTKGSGSVKIEAKNASGAGADFQYSFPAHSVTIMELDVDRSVQ